MQTDRVWVVIPTYWGPSDLGIYDHPTPINGVSTLPALLESLAVQQFDSNFNVLVLVSAVSEEFEELAAVRVTEIVKKYQEQLQLYIADASTARKVDDILAAHQLDLGVREMRGYAAVRNMQLLLPSALGAEVVIALDDDEVVVQEYLKKAMELIGKEVGGKPILGLVGPYLNDDGSPYLQEPTQVTNLLIDKAVLINKTIRDLIANSDDLPITPIGFGGNMIFHREMFSRVGFDPAIPRGEDVDYIINARIAGIPFYFSPQLTINHRPPRHFEAPMYAKLRQDVFRFIYEQKKIDFFGVSPELLEPYPGLLLKEDFPQIAMDALSGSVEPKLAAKFGSPEEILTDAFSHADRLISRYIKFMTQWKTAVGVLKKPSNSKKVDRSIQMI